MSAHSFHDCIQTFCHGLLGCPFMHFMLRFERSSLFESFMKVVHLNFVAIAILCFPKAKKPQQQMFIDKPHVYTTHKHTGHTCMKVERNATHCNDKSIGQIIRIANDAEQNKTNATNSSDMHANGEGATGTAEE